MSGNGHFNIAMLSQKKQQTLMAALTHKTTVQYHLASSPKSPKIPRPANNNWTLRFPNRNENISSFLHQKTCTPPFTPITPHNLYTKHLVHPCSYYSLRVGCSDIVGKTGRALQKKRCMMNSWGKQATTKSERRGDVLG